MNDLCFHHRVRYPHSLWSPLDIVSLGTLLPVAFLAPFVGTVTNPQAVSRLIRCRSTTRLAVAALPGSLLIAADLSSSEITPILLK